MVTPRDTGRMDAFGIVVVGVLVVGIVVGVLLLRRPDPYAEIGGGGLDDTPDPASGPPAPVIDDEAEFRELLRERRAARLRREGRADELERPLAQGPPWAHMESDVVEEARGLVARRRARLARQGKPDVDEQAELERLLGPPHV